MANSRSSAFLLFLLLLMLAPPRVCAAASQSFYDGVNPVNASEAAAPAAADPATQPETLAAVLASARRPAEGVALAVAADRVNLPAGAAPPSPQASLGFIADRFGRLVRQFGAVTAIAPPTMTLVNTKPQVNNLFIGMPPSAAGPLLMASLNDAQWQALLSQDGLAISSLKGAYQQGLLGALFPGGGMNLGERTDYGGYSTTSIHTPRAPSNAPAEPDVSGAAISRGHLRLTRKMIMELPLRRDPGARVMIAGRTSKMTESVAYSPDAQIQPQDSIYGEWISREVPNVPKLGQIDLNAPRFQEIIPVGGLKTAGDLVARIARLTHTEIYVDRRSEGKTLTMIGAAGAPAKDLLAALAFCLTGTYRNVLSAFVLTDDLAGVGARQEILSEFRQSVDRQREELVGRAEAELVTRHSIWDLPVSAGSITLTPEQIHDAAQSHPGLPLTELTGFKIPVSKLTPEQRRAEQIAAGAPGEEIDLTGDVTLDEMASLELLTPSLAQPVSLDNYAAADHLFEPPAKFLPAWNPPPPPAPPSPADLLKPYAHRAAIVYPRRETDIAPIIAAMLKLGLNEMWVDLNGPGTPENSAALFDAASQQALKYNIVALPVVNVLRWSSNAEHAAQDLNILGENSITVDAKIHAEQEERLGRQLPTAAPGLYVSPFAPNTHDRLSELLKRMGSMSGRHGMVWMDLDPPGYRPFEFEEVVRQMGYTPSARLEFLRKEHADPIDIREGFPGLSAVKLPEFDDTSIEKSLKDEWQQFRTAAVEQFINTLTSEATSDTNGTFRSGGPILVEGNSYFFRWENVRLPLLTQTDYQGPMNEMLARLKNATGFALRKVPANRLTSTRELADFTGGTDRDPRWDGIVLDCAPTASPAASSASVLTHLAAGVPDTTVVQKKQP